MSDGTVDCIRVALAVAFTVGMVACAVQAALVLNDGHHRLPKPAPCTSQWGYRLVGFLSLVAAFELIVRV
ncbi:MAG: hypothetical protein E6G39_17250 [Actinobacteria bacterium]|nr:MAG: hypothetical protein E6G39_17250 [Actinomycetota bacterium]